MVHEKVNDSDILMEPLHYPTATSAGELDQAPAPPLSVDAQICVTQAVVVAERENSPQASEQSKCKMSPQAPGCTRRNQSGEVDSNGSVWGIPYRWGTVVN